MECGASLTSAAPERQLMVPASKGTASSDTDWAGIAAGFLAGMSTRRLSRKARQTAFIVVFLLLFFGCPMACGVVAFLVEAVGKLFGWA